jgi:hypothetical protein
MILGSRTQTRLASHSQRRHILSTDDRPNLCPTVWQEQRLAWFVRQGYEVVDAVLSHLAVEQFFEELEVEPQITISVLIRRYKVATFNLSVQHFQPEREATWPVNILHYRAAMVALPDETRDNCANQIVAACDYSVGREERLVCD